jgi:Na+/H+-dicarboxylate symporter
MKKLGLLPRLIIAIIVGILIGFYWELGTKLLVTFTGIFGNFLNFVIPLIILGFVIPGIADLGSGAGKTLAITAGIAYGSTIIFGTLQYLVASTILPKFITADLQFSPDGGRKIDPFFVSPMEPIFGVTTALIIAFILGVGIASLGEDGNILKKAVHEFADIITKLINFIIIPLLPIHIAGIFANMAYGGEVARVMSVFSRVFILIIIMHWLVILIQYTIGGIVGGQNPFYMVKCIIPAYMTAIGTQSSAATIPVTLNSTLKMGVHKSVADFVIPLCATIHLTGSTVTLLTCSMAVMMMQGQHPTLGQMFPFILMLGVTMVAAPGVPGGAVMAALGILQSMLGFDEALLGLMIALYTAQDSFGTACNITGDSAIAAIVNKISGFKMDPDQNEALLNH